MKLPMHWLQEFANITAGPAEVDSRLTMSGSKVERYEDEHAHLKNVVVGRIEQLRRHENSDHLWICQVDVGSETVQIVTGAQNLSEGDVCPVALHGAALPGGQTIKRGKLRGEASEGMLCSLDELGLTTHDFPTAAEDGILVLQTDAKPGDDAAAALGLDDVIFEFEITPNRPDCLSVRGLAREAAATFAVPFRDEQPPEAHGEGNAAALLAVGIDVPDSCARYSAAIVENVRIAESPFWMRKRLRQCGVRPINNIVDITNYVMLEYGQPMHAFDYAYVNGQRITVRGAKQDESIVTLDGTTRPLAEDMMIIADEKGPIAVAGIMGGEYSGVYETTRRVVFEAANFNGPSVRATSRKLGLRTESSTRFEKGLDAESVGPAMRRALQLVTELGAGDVVGNVLEDYPRPPAPRTVPLDDAAINKLLGITVETQQMEDILRPLGFEITNDVVKVPSFRADVARVSDLAEEVARFVGYNNMPATVLQGAAAARPTAHQSFARTLCNTLCGYGFWECETFSFYSPKSFDAIRLPAGSPLRNAIQLLHPLGEDTSIMRTTALPSMMEVVGRNWAARNETAALFELATTYLPGPSAEQLPEERQTFVLAAYGDEWDYLALKGAVEGLCQTAGLATETLCFKRNAEGHSYHPGRCADVYLQCGDTQEYLGRVGEIHPEVAAQYGVKNRVVAAELYLDVLFRHRGATPQFRPLPKFPAVTRDLALVAGQDVPAATIERTLRQAAGTLLESLALFDVYTGETLGPGKKSLAYSLVLRRPDATLTDEEADAAVQRILKALAGIDVVLRS